MYAFSPHFFLVLGGTGWLCDNYMFFMFSSQMHHGESTSLQCCYAVPLGVTGYLTDEWNPFLSLTVLYHYYHYLITILFQIHVQVCSKYFFC